MIFQINFKSGMPIYLQLVDQIKAAAASGALRSGEALPSIARSRILLPIMSSRGP